MSHPEPSRHPATLRSIPLRLSALRTWMRQSALGDPTAPSDKKHRPPWVLRIACTAADLGTVAIICSAAMSAFTGPSPQTAPVAPVAPAAPPASSSPAPAAGTATTTDAAAPVAPSADPSAPTSSLPPPPPTPSSLDQMSASDQLASASLIILVPAYYLFWEWFAGRTPAKMVLGLKMISTSGELSRARMLWRGMARFIPLLQLLMLLSWRRVTLLDLITGTRVQSIPRHRPQRMRGSAASTGSSQPTRPANNHGGTTLSAPTPSSAPPRGYDENLSQR